MYKVIVVMLVLILLAACAPTLVGENSIAHRGDEPAMNERTLVALILIWFATIMNSIAIMINSGRGRR